MTDPKSKSVKSPAAGTVQLKLRQPITVIAGTSKTLMRDKNLARKDIHADLKKINVLAEKLLHLFDTITATKSGSGKRAGDVLQGLDAQTVHGLRTPLNGIIGFTELLLEDLADEMTKKSLTGLQKILISATEFLSALDNSTRHRTAAVSAADAPPAAPGRDKPVETAKAAIPQPAAARSLPAAVKSGVILVVDDSEVNRDLLSSQLGRQGHSVKLAADGREALARLQREPVDLVLLDIVMPIMNGFQVLEQIGSSPDLGDIPIIVISALDNIDSVVQCIQMGAEDYLLKPFNPVLLKARINTCLEKKRLIELSKDFEQRNLKEEVQFVAESRVMREVLNTVRIVSRNPVNILLHGSSGTGKEVIARMIHNGSDRRENPFVAVNCASIPENLMESEFFGYEKGAFTGAAGSRAGYFEEAAGGTLFLDEIGDMPMFVQPKLLRAIEEGEGRRLGSNKAVSYDVRIISATNKDLRKEVKEKRFRKDLFYRIFSVEIKIPPLNERRADIVPLAIFFLNTVSKRFHKKISGYSSDVLNFFERYPWPGNVRQLLHEVERLVAFTPDGSQVSLKYCSPELNEWNCSCSAGFMDNNSNVSLPEKIKELEISCIADALRQTGGKKLPAAKLLGITRVGLDNKIKRYGITLP